MTHCRLSCNLSIVIAVCDLVVNSVIAFFHFCICYVSLTLLSLILLLLWRSAINANVRNWMSALVHRCQTAGSNAVGRKRLGGSHLLNGERVKWPFVGRPSRFACEVAMGIKLRLNWRRSRSTSSDDDLWWRLSEQVERRKVTGRCVYTACETLTLKRQRQNYSLLRCWVNVMPLHVDIWHS